MRIPTPVQRGAPVGSLTVDPLQPVFQNVQFANNQELSQNLGQLGTGISDLNSQIAQRRDRVNLRQAEAEWNAFEQELTDPTSGLYTARGINASGTTDRLTAMMDEKRAELTARYGEIFSTGTGNIALQEMMDGRSSTLWRRGADFEIAQLDQADRAQSAALIETAADRASTYWNDDAEYESAVTIAASSADVEGQPEAAAEALVQEAVSAVVLGRANALLQNAPSMVKEFMQREVDAGRMDRTAADEWLSRNNTAIINRTAAALVDQSAAASTLPFPMSDPVRGSAIDIFLGRLIGSESSGRPAASATIDDGRTFSGLGGVGEARLTDMKTAGVVPQDMTLAEFSTAENADLQRDALRWSIADIDLAIDATGALSRGYSRDGLRAVAHLGGKGGMRRFINSGGRYNVDDGYTLPDGTEVAGTSLQDYYDKFSGQNAGGMTVDERIGAEPDPEVREAAFATLDARRARQYRADERLSQEVTTAIITGYEVSQRDGTPFSLEDELAREGVAEALGSRIEAVRAYVHRLETGADVITDTGTIQRIEALIADDPEAFRERDLIAYYGDGLSNDDMKRYLREQTSARVEYAKPPDPADAWTRPQMSSLVGDIAQANGIGSTGDDAVPFARLLGQAMDISRWYAETNDGARIPAEVLETRMRQSIQSTVPTYDPTGNFGQNDAKYGEKF